MASIAERRTVIGMYRYPTLRQAEDIYRRASKDPRVKVVCFGENHHRPMTSGFVPYWVRDVRRQLSLIKDINRADEVRIIQPISSSPHVRRRLHAGRR